MPADSLRTRLLLLLAAGFLAAQIVVPAIALFGPRPSRFGWHMYSALPRLPEAWIVRPDGPDQRVDVSALFAAQRAEIDYLAVLRSELCGVTDAAAIRLEVPNEPVEVADC